MRDYERRNANRKSVLAAIERARLRPTPATARLRLSGMEAAATTRPRRGAELELDRRRARLRRQRRRPARRLRPVRAGAVPGDRVRAVVTKRKRALRRGAHARGRSSPSPERIAPRRRPPRRAVAGAALRAPARDQGGAGRRRAAAHRQASTASSSSRSSRPSSSGATATSSSSRSARPTTARSSAASTRPARGSASCRSTTACSRPSAATRAPAPVLDWCRAAGPDGLRPPRRSAGFLRNLVVREGRRTGELQVRLVTAPRRRSTPTRFAARGRLRRPVLDADRRRSPRRRTGGDTELLAGAPQHRRGARRAALRDLPRGVLPDEHRDGRAALRRRAPSTRRSKGWERVYDLFCGIGTIGLTLAPRAGEVWGLEIVEEAVADAIANARANEIAQRALLRRRRAPGDARARRAGRPARRARRRPAARGPVPEGRAPRSSRRRPSAIVYVSCNPTTLAPNAAQLAEAGYALRRVRPVDMFPQTPHIECVALLDRTA